MPHTIHDKKKLLTRVRRIKGQAEALEKALDSGERSCLDILQQIAAIRGAVNGLMGEVLEGHIRSHLMNEEADPSERSADLEAIVSVIRSYMK
ncbi:metal/formaldehyde-sensitive transcriptional repressor [Dickeya lacustris]|uniref:Metal/formaldehyde-sensitive transcriptional repressor n=1 Tax=Dickeya lacustris TaxID=2259638 RepID=A0ABY8G3F9_9GAMM|nr:metal/formaldehyde-sensitive transcriptional repressor [Dickeya lacustris]WFN54462.1 metal/formaldehyde-sensitive transcriptional repressor [Dickeya lacustris]